jgi:hypothetical protein
MSTTWLNTAEERFTQTLSGVRLSPRMYVRTFMEDLSELLNAATGDQRRRKSFYEIDTEFEKMTASLLKNFTSMASLMPFLRASLRQRMMGRLATVGKDKDGWKKADEHLTILMDQEHMITLRTLMQLSNDASNTYNVLPLMRDLPCQGSCD